MLDIKRIENDINNIIKFNRTPGNGYTRFSYSKEDLEAKDYIINELKNLGAVVTVDGVGNIRGRLEGEDKNLSTIMIGSHVDTVLNGGKFDGLLGVVASLEVLRVISKNKIGHKRGIELVVFSEEEGSNFGTTMVGSKVLTGAYNLEDIKKLRNYKGISMYDMVKEIGLNPDNIHNTIVGENEVYSMIELHIEQGEVLHSEELPIGIVQAIAGMKSFKIDIHGVGNHAGATPMNLRKDPMLGGAKFIVELENIIKKHGIESTVGTVGRLTCSPNSSNVIANDVSVYVDLRDILESSIELVEINMKKYLSELCQEMKLEYSIELIGESKPVVLSSDITKLIEKKAKLNAISYKVMNSGAVHDSALMVDKCKVGMIFVPSINGRSHVPEENTSYEHIEIGAQVLFECIYELSQC